MIETIIYFLLVTSFVVSLFLGIERHRVEKSKEVLNDDIKKNS